MSSPFIWGGNGPINLNNPTTGYLKSDASGNITSTASAGGETNFISDGDAEGSNIFTEYADTAGTRPVDGTGGTPNVTSAISSSSPLIGSNSFILTKDAANRQGEGWAIDFTIDAAYKAKVLQIELDYIVNSGTFVAGSSSADSDVIVYIYDVTNSKLIEPSSFKFLSNSSTISDKFTANFQSSADSTSYRLIFHVASTSASAYSLKVDGIKVKPSVYVYGTPITDKKAFTPTFTGFGTVSNNNCFWWREGDSLSMEINFTSGTSTATTASVSLPSGLSIDTSKLDTSGSNIFGFGIVSSAAAVTWCLIAANTGGTVLYFSQQSASNSGIGPLNGSNYLSSGQSAHFIVRNVPIQGWSSSVQMSDGYDGRLIAASYQASSGQSITSTAVITMMGTKLYDTTNSYNTVTGVYTVPSAGK